MSSPLASETRSPTSRDVVWSVAAITVIVVAAGTLAVADFARSTRAATGGHLAAAVTNRMSAYRWHVEERLADARLLASHDEIIASLEGPGAVSDAARVIAASELRAIVREYRYTSATLYDTAWRVVEGNRSTEPTAAMRAAEAAARSSGDAVVVPFHRNADGVWEWGVLAPVVGRDTAAAPRGMLYLTRSGEHRLIPALRDDLIGAETYEGLLWQVDGDSLLLVGSSRLAEDPALRGRRIAAGVASSAGRAALAPGTLLIGPDYRGIEAFGVAQPVPGTPWILVAKIDRQEADRAIWLFGWGILGVALLLVALVGGIGRIVWLRRQRAFDQRQSALALRAAHVVESTTDGYVVMDGIGRILEVNGPLCEITGYTPDEFRTMRLADVEIEFPSDQIAEALERIRIAGSARFPTRWRTKAGGAVHLDISTTFYRSAEGDFFIGFLRDVTADLASRARLERLNRLYAFLNRTSETLFGITDPMVAYRTMCDLAVEECGFAVVWVGLTDAAAGVVRPVAAAGRARGYTDGLRVTLDPALPTSQGPASRAIREGQPVVVNDFLTNSSTVAWQSAALSHGLGSAVGFPVVVGGEAIGTLVFYEEATGAFDDESVGLLGEAGRLLSLVLQAVETSRAREVEAERRQRSEELFRDLFESSPVASIVVHREQRYLTRLNRAFRTLFGYRLEDMPTLQALAERFFPDPAQRTLVVASFQERLTQLEPGRPIRSGDLAVRNATGEPLTVEAFAAVIGDEVVLSWIDLTELRASQAIAREAEQFARLAGWRYDFATGTMFRAEEYISILGLDEAVPSGLSSELFSLAAPDVAESLRADFFRAAEAGELFSKISPVAMPDGTTRWFRLEARFEYDPAGRPLRAVGTTQDITAQHLVALELERYRTHLEELVAARTAELKRANESLTIADRRLTAMLQLSQRASMLTEREVLQLAIDQASWLTGSHGGYLLVIAADGKHAEAGYWASGTTATPGSLTSGIVELGEAGAWRDAVADGRPVVLNETDTAQALAPLVASDVHFTRHAVVPVLEGGAVRLLIGVGDKATPYESGDVHELQLIGRDVWTIVQRRRAELELQQALERLRISDERFAFAMDASHEGVWDWDLASGAVAVNTVFATMLGYPPEALAPTAETIIGLLHPEDREATLVQMQRAFASTTVAAAEFRMRHADGSWRWVLMRGKAFSTDADGRPLRAVGTISDLTARKQAEDELRAAKEQADSANRAKSSFLAVMSHEIRTPLNGVVGMAEVLAESPLPPRELDAVRTIRTSATSLLGLIDDILDFSKIEAGRLELDITDTDLEAVADLVCEALGPVAAAKQAELSLFIDPRLPTRVRTDGTRVRQILYNLLGNAVKFSANQGDRKGRVAVRLECVHEDPLRIALQVRDNGIGIAPEDLGRLFTSFTQAETSTTRRFGGTGLGLAITKRLVDLFGGEITVESVPGVGSTFRVELPMTASAEQPVRTLPEVGGVEVVVIRSADEPTEADEIALILRTGGAAVTLVSDIPAAMAEAEDRPPPVVVIGADSTLGDAAEGAGPPIRAVRITQGRRRAPRMVSPSLITLDRSSMRDATLRRAVAIAAGRASPVVSPEPGEVPIVTPGTHAPTIEEARAAGRLILVAEDDEVNQRVIVRQLELLGYAAEVVPNGRDALERWRTERYGLLLTDLHMPEMDGYTLASTIRREEAPGTRMPILALTANALRGEEVRARSAGLDAYLTKPIRLKDLRDAIEAWLPGGEPSAAIPADPERPAPEARAVLDLNVLRGLVGDDDAVLASLLEDFRASTDRLVPELETAMTAGDLPTVGSIAHRLKSSSRSIGALEVAEQASLLEAAARTNATASVAALQPAFTRAWAALQAALPSTTSMP